MCVALSAGSTDTSLWTHYRAGEREYCGNRFPDGLRKNDRSGCWPKALLHISEGSVDPDFWQAVGCPALSFTDEMLSAGKAPKWQWRVEAGGV